MNEIRINFPDGYSLFVAVRKYNGDIWNKYISQFVPVGEWIKSSKYLFSMSSVGLSMYIANFPAGIPKGKYDVQIFRFDKDEKLSPVGIMSFTNRHKIFSAFRSLIVQVFNGKRAKSKSVDMAVNISAV